MHRPVRSGLFRLAAREKHCKNAGVGHTRRPFARPCESNFDGPLDILDWHVAAILIPFRSRGLG
jgi:hypothetical protein